jgi:secondary thiamine-phosphate synthase enzyme
MALTQASTTITVSTRGPGFTDLTHEVQEWLRKIGARDGLLTAYIRHTSASLTIQENADPDVRRDLLDALDRLAPRSQEYRHRTEGSDDMPAHIKSALTSVSTSIPVVNGRAAFGTWQALYLVEHRDAPHRREVVLHFLGETA